MAHTPANSDRGNAASWRTPRIRGFTNATAARAASVTSSTALASGGVLFIPTTLRSNPCHIGPFSHTAPWRSDPRPAHGRLGTGDYLRSRLVSPAEVTGVAQRQAWRDHVLPPVERVRPGLWSVPVPIPDNPLRYVLVHLLEL